VDGTGSGSCPVVDLDISGVKPSDCAATRVGADGNYISGIRVHVMHVGQKERTDVHTSGQERREVGHYSNCLLYLSKRQGVLYVSDTFMLQCRHLRRFPF
jgi:hypothetical protein